MPEARTMPATVTRPTMSDPPPDQVVLETAAVCRLCCECVASYVLRVMFLSVVRSDEL